MPDKPIDNLVRALAGQEDDVRAAATGDGRTLHGYFAVFNRWTEIDSMWEGQFMERIAPGAFTEVFTRSNGVKVLYDHGQDPQLGNKPLGAIQTLEERKQGAYYEVDLIDTDYNDRFVIPAAQAGLLGASFRFKVAGEEWVDPKKATVHNPKVLPERTITQVDPLYEFGPVTFPAYPEGTDAGIRSLSLSDTYLERLLKDPVAIARFAKRAGVEAIEDLIAGLRSTDAQPPAEELDETPDDSTAGQPPRAYTPIARPRLTLEAMRAQRATLAGRLESALSRKDG